MFIAVPILRSCSSWDKLAHGELPVPEVATLLEQGSKDSRDSDTFVGSFGSGGVYTGDEDPIPRFNYTSPILSAVNLSMGDCRRVSSSSPQFVDIPLSDEETQICGLTSASAHSPTSSLESSSPKIIVTTTSEKFSDAVYDTCDSVQSLQDVEGSHRMKAGVQHKVSFVSFSFTAYLFFRGLSHLRCSLG